MSDQKAEHVSLLIIGSGPAGYTAAIYAARASLDPVVYAGEQWGGQLMLTTDVENYPGYPEGILGPKMMDDFRKQAARFGTDIRFEKVTKADLTSNPKKAWTDSGHEVHADAIVISTGADARWLGLESEQRLRGAGVSSCAVCDGFFFKGTEVAVVGGGDSACEDASYLSKVCSHVHMLVRRDKMRASQIMQDRVKKADNITIHWNTEVEEVLGEQEVEGLRVYNNQSETTSQMDVAALFVAIGHIPNTEIFKGQLDMDEQGYLYVDKDSSRTNIEGVFAGGDVHDNVYRQAVTAAGSGCKAALDAERWLSAQGLH
jgi:thioredoxin reductase (NADPH)